MEDKQIQTETNPQSSFLPESLKDAAALQKFKDVESLATGYISLEKEIGSRVKVPDFNSDDTESLDKFYSKIGRPETPEGYTIDGIEDAESIKNIFHKTGLNNKQASEIANLLKGKKMLDADNFSQEGANKLADETFGDRKLEVLTKVDKVIKSVMTEEEITALNELDNRAVVSLYKAIDKLYDVKEGQIISPSGGQSDKGIAKPDYAQFSKDLAELQKRPHSEIEVEALKIKNNIK
jgi:hypothetical protein